MHISAGVRGHVPVDLAPGLVPHQRPGGEQPADRGPAGCDSLACQPAASRAIVRPTWSPRGVQPLGMHRQRGTLVAAGPIRFGRAAPAATVAAA